MRKDYRVFTSKSQSEAMLNEFKGNLFEFLVAQCIARRFDVETQFLQGFDDSTKTQLKTYQEYILNHDSELYKKLPILAQGLANPIIEEIKNKKIKNIVLVGKVNKKIKKNYLESDILCLAEDYLLPLSIKLIKEKSYVNTKSGGIKTFLEKYFPFTDASIYQDELNLLLNNFFSEMSFKLHKEVGLDYDSDFSSWIESGYSVLPGKLPPSQRSIIFNYYYQLVTKLHFYLSKFYYSDKKKFANFLLPLCGLSSTEILQAYCCYGNSVKEGRYLPRDTHVLRAANFIKELENISIGKVKENQSSFEIFSKNLKLQIRVKPMNKFTVPACKINCSIKFSV